MTAMSPGRAARRVFLLLVAITMLTWAGPASADTKSGAPGAGGPGKPSLLVQARELAGTSRNWQDRRQKFTLRVFDSRSNERVRELLMLTRRERPGTEKTLAVFLGPADVRGTTFLQHVDSGAPSTQWLYLPDLGRSRKIHGGARRQSFVGTDFSYADLDLIENALHWTQEDAIARPLPPGPGAAGEGRVRFELRPQQSDATYERVVLELSEGDVLLRSIEMYESAEGPPDKILLFEDIREVDGIPTAFRMNMKRPKNGTRTIVDVSGVEYGGKIADDAFTKRALENGLDHVD